MTRFRTLAPAAILTVGVSAVLAPAALADPDTADRTGKAYVSFGDSFAANPGMTDKINDTGRMGQMCGVSTTNIGYQTAEILDMSHADYSCNGSVVYMPNAPEKSLTHQVDQAISSGDIGDGTELVTLMIGANDAMQTFWAPDEITDGQFQEKATDALLRITEAAPEAHVMMVGYPEITGANNAEFCGVNVAGHAPEVSLPAVQVKEKQLQDNQRRAAEQSGTQFLDMKAEVPVDVGMCATGDNQYVATFVDDNIGQYNMTNHLTHDGSVFYAETIANAHHKFIGVADDAEGQND